MTAPSAGIHFWADNNLVGLFIHSSGTTRETKWGETKLLGSWFYRFNFRWLMRRTEIQNHRKVKEIQAFRYFYHNHWCLKLGYVVSCLQTISRCFTVTSCPIFFPPSTYCWYFVCILWHCFQRTFVKRFECFTEYFVQYLQTTNVVIDLNQNKKLLTKL